MKEIDYERMNDLDRALEIALDAHSGDTDKANEAYIRHPLRVMQAMDTKTERIVALLHDVVEDSEYTLTEIKQEFNKEICDAVDCLTNFVSITTATDRINHPMVTHQRRLSRQCRVC